MAMEELSKKSTLSGTFQMFYNAIDMLFFFFLDLPADEG